MKKLIRHKWKKVVGAPSTTYQCEKCGCVRYWDYDYDCIMYKWGTHLTYKGPKCIVYSNGQKPYN